MPNGAQDIAVDGTNACASRWQSNRVVITPGKGIARSTGRKARVALALDGAGEGVRASANEGFVENVNVFIEARLDMLALDGAEPGKKRLFFWRRPGRQAF